MVNEASEFYSKRREKYSDELLSVTRRINRFVWYRFLAFISIFSPLFVFEVKSWATLIFSLLGLSLFLYLVKRNFILDKKRKKLIQLNKITENELLALDHNFSHFDTGEEFLDTNHFFSYDLDLFGKGSLFQYLNRTSTSNGRKKLADWLISPPSKKRDIERRQEAIKELTAIPNWRLHFLANGNLFAESPGLSREIRAWSGMDFGLNNASSVKWMIRVIPLLTIVATAVAISGITSAFLVIAVLLQWSLMYFYWKRITHYFNFFGRKSELLSKYMQLLEFIEKRNFKAEYLLEIQKKVIKPSKASKVFNTLKSLVKELEYRQNLVVGIFLNSFFLWDIRCVYKLWFWHKKNHARLAGWLDTMAEMDALISLANYNYNHPGFTYPEIHDGGFTMAAEQIGHPLLHKNKRICNDLEINGWSKVLIITGANMAGKSTFLRTVGVNLILARIGASVCASRMRVSPVEVYTNMRTTDSLLKDESYFFAELKRIKGVLERLERGERILVILDEMLKGTNSIDKLNGSRELIRKLVELESVALIATHDLKLSEMENEFPQQVFNKCFEIKIEDNEMVFDYLLSEGVTKTMNATFLMKKMGII